MIASLVADLVSASLAMIASSSDGGAPGWLLLLGPAGGGGVYFFSWRYYRNTHRSHGFERETRIEAQSVTGDDRQINSITGTTKSGVDGNNRSAHRRRVQRVD